MTYPKTKLTRPIRFSIMIFLIILFFVVSPIIILYTAGYRYDFGTQEVMQTGVISIDTKPKDASVFINDVIIDQSIPIRLANRAPGTYHLRIEAEGYKTWEKDITVQSKQTTYIKNITLFKEDLPIQLLNDPGELRDNVSFSADGHYAILVTSDDTTHTIQLFNTQTEELRSLSAIISSSTPNISWSPFYDRAAIFYESDNAWNVHFVNPETPLDLESSYIVATNNLQYQWNPDKQESTLYLHDTNDGIVEISSSRKRRLQKNTTSTAWYIDERRNLFTYQDNNISSEDFFIRTEESITKIIHANSNRIIAASNDRVHVYQLTEPRNSATIDANKFAYSQGTEEWLVWSPWELWTVYKDGNRELLNRTGEPFEDVIPLDEYGVLLLKGQTSLQGFNPGYYISHTLFDGDSPKAIGVNQTNRIMYFYGTVGTSHGLFSQTY